MGHPVVTATLATTAATTLATMATATFSSLLR